MHPNVFRYISSYILCAESKKKKKKEKERKKRQQHQLCNIPNA